MPLFKIILSAHLVYGLVDIFVLIKLRECYISSNSMHTFLVKATYIGDKLASSTHDTK